MEQIENSEEEQLVAEWTEPVLSKPVSRRRTLAILGVGLLVAAASSALAFFIQDTTFYFAAAAAFAASLAIALQKRRPFEPLPISLTTKHLQVGKRVFDLTSLAGFWLEDEASSVVINVEPDQPTMFPIAFRYPGHAEEARELMSTQMHEVEARPEGITEKINRFIKL